MSTRVKHIIKKLWSLPPKDREVWLQAIMAEFEEDFSHSIWREGYEQGKSEGEWVGQQLKDADKIRQELNKPVVQQFVADWIEECKAKEKSLLKSLLYTPEGVNSWVDNSENQDLFARAWLDGYEVEKEKRYEVIMRNAQSLKTVYRQGSDHFDFEMVYGTPENFTKKQLEDAGFGWVFDCEGVRVEEVE